SPHIINGETMQSTIKSNSAAAQAAPRQGSLVERLCARAIVSVFLPYAGRQSPAASESRLLSPATSPRQSKPFLMRPTASRAWFSERFLALETARRYVANYARAFAAVAVGCGPLLVAAACVVLLSVADRVGAGSSSRPGTQPRRSGRLAQEQHEQPERERLEQFISSISYRQRRRARNLIRVDQLDSVSQIVDYTNQPTDAGDRCAICLESSASDRVRVLACKHAFHAECIEPWLTT
ncbi:hypothetical protein LPJ75_004537, partial [Coemansia sp. RSA 2598]